MTYFTLQLLILFQQFYTFVNSQVPTSGCNAISDEGVCFTSFTGSRINWGDARLECVSRGYDIATVTSTEENTLMYNTADIHNCWIGLNDKDDEGTFVWADGSNSSYRNWANREPNQQGNEDCVHTIGNERWNDLACTKSHSCYICRANVIVFGQISGSTYLSLADNTVLTSNTSLYCVTENKGTPQVVWSYLNRDGIKTDLPSTTDASTGVSTIQAYTTQLGYYTCEVSQNGGMNIGTYTAVMAAIPVITSPAQDNTENLTNLEDFERTLNCSATGAPAPEVYWSKSTNISERIGTSSMLDITSVLPTEFTNIFYCVAVNSVGKDVITVTYVINIETALYIVQESLGNSNDISPEMAMAIVESIQQSLQNSLDDNSLDNEVLTTIVELIEQVVDKINGTFSNETTKLIVATLDTVINSTDSLEQPETEKGSIATVSTAVVVALRTLEKFSARLLEELVDGDRSVNIVQSGSIVIINQVVNLNTTNRENEMIKLPIKTGQEYSVSLSLPLDVATYLSKDDRRLPISSSILTRNPARKAGSEGTYQASDILTISLIGQNGTINLRNEVPLRFDVSENLEGMNFVCVSLNGSNWDSEGLTTIAESGVTICRTNHFTSFAVFVTPYKRETGITNKILSILSYILVSISFISLIISLVLFIIAGKAFFKVETNIIYFNYCISLLIATGVFLFGIESGKFDRIVCTIVAFLLHYTWLAVFTWTLCIGILIMFKLVIGVLSTRKIYPYLIVFGWIFPLIIPLVTVIVTNTVKNTTYVDPTMHCFLTYEGGIIWSFIAPVVIILVINVVFLVIAIAKIVYTKLNNPNNELKVVLKDTLITALVLTPVLGIPWLCLILNVSIQHVVLEFVFIFLNGLIGAIFLFVVVLRNKEVYTLLCKRKSIKDSGQPATDRTGKSLSTDNVQVSNKFKIAGVNTLEKAKTEYLDVIVLENKWIETK